MKKQEKNQFIDTLAERLSSCDFFYMTDISNLNAKKTSELRRLCFRRNIELMMVKNTLLRKALEKTEKDYSEVFGLLKGTTSLMFSEVPNDPAKLIKEFRKTSDRPILKGAFIQEMVVAGDDKIDFLINIKSKNELVADVILALQSPLLNVMSALNSGKHTLAGIVKTLSEKNNN